MYKPTPHSTMSIMLDSEPNAWYLQFGPVNTYFMDGSFKVRIGELDPQNPFYSIFGLLRRRTFLAAD